MNKLKCHKIYLMLGFLILQLQALCQSSNTEILNQANQFYGEGKYESVINLLANKTQAGNFNKLEQQQAIRILSSAYIKLDENVKGEELVFALLKKDPTYEVQTTLDPLPFKKTLDVFESKPKLKVGFNIGQYQSIINNNKSYFTWNVSDATNSYTSKPTLSVSFFTQYLINKSFGLKIEPTFTKIDFNQQISYPERVSLTYTESSSLIKVPLLFNVNVLNKEKLLAFVEAGFYGSLIGETESSLSYQIAESGEFNATGFEGLQREKYNYGYQVGLGLSYKKNRLQFNTSFTYGKDLKSFAIKDNSSNNNALLTDYYYTPDNLYLDNIEFKIGVSYTISYKVKHKYPSK